MEEDELLFDFALLVPLFDDSMVVTDEDGERARDDRRPGGDREPDLVLTERRLPASLELESTEEDGERARDD